MNRAGNTNQNKSKGNSGYKYTHEVIGNRWKQSGQRGTHEKMALPATKEGLDLKIKQDAMKEKRQH